MAPFTAVLALIASTAVPASGTTSAVTGVNFLSVISGDQTSCALTTTPSTLYCWGDNTNWQLLNGSANPSLTPTVVNLSSTLSGAAITGYASGSETSCVLTSNSQIYCWGYGGQGQLGNGAFAGSHTPKQVAFTVARTGIIARIAGSGTNTFCALTTTSQIWCWGGNVYGSLGNNTTANSSTPVRVYANGALASKHIISIAGSGNTFCAVDSAGAAYCWGDGTHGALGNGSTSSSSVPVAVSTSGALSGKSIRQIAPADDHTCAVDTTGTVYCWGSNDFGTLGLGLPDGLTTASSMRTTPQAVTALSAFTLTAVTSSGSESCALDTAGGLHCWGAEPIGDGYLENNALSPVTINGGLLSGVTLARISSSDYGTCAVDTGGSLYCWGINDFGQAGDNSTNPSAYPEQIATSPNAPSGTTVPGPPTGPTLQPSPQQIEVDWSPPINDGGSPILHYTATATNGSDVFSCTGTGASAATCTITGLTNGAIYNVNLVATNAIGDSSIVHVGSAIPAHAPDAPTLLTATPAPRSLVLIWSPAANNGGSALNEWIGTATSGANSSYCVSTKGSATGCTIANLNNGTQYSVSIVSVNPVGTSPPSNIVLATPVDVPTVPQNVTLTVHQKSVTVAWHAPLSNGGLSISGYTVTTNPVTPGCSTAGALSCTVNGLNPMTPYTFSVLATNSKGSSKTATSLAAYPFAPPKIGLEVLTPVLTRSTPFTVVLANAPSNAATFTLSKLTVKCTVNLLRQCAVKLSEPNAGAFRILAKAGPAPATLYVWVPAVVAPATGVHGKTAIVKINFCPPHQPATLTLSDGRKFGTTTTALGVATFYVPLKKRGVLFLTPTVQGTKLAAFHISVS